MDAVKGILATVTGVVGPVFGSIDRVLSAVVQILTQFSVAIFVAGFVGILFAFLWFLFRYLDKKKITIPALVFTLFFLIFLSGNMLLIARDAKLRESPSQEAAVQSAENTEDAEASGEVAI
jgi:hypothetical protein